MIEIEPEVPRSARLAFMIGGGILLFALVMALIIIGRTPEPSHRLDNDGLPPIQQRYNVDALRPQNPTPPVDDQPSTPPIPTTRPATRPTTRPATVPSTMPALLPDGS